MAKVICTVCGREIDSRGLSGHMKTHVSKEDDTDGVISYPSNDQKIHDNVDSVDKPGAETKIHEGAQGKPAKKKPVKKTVASKPASSPTSKPDAGGQDKPYHKSREWQGLFRD